LAIDRTAYNTLNASVIVAYNNVEIKFEGDGNITNLDPYGYFYDVGSNYYAVPQPGVVPTSAKLTVTTKQPGATAVIVITLDSNKQLTGTVTVNGKVVGTIKPDPKTGALLVTYVDGSFETVAL
jgi:hypothetical protein